MNPTLRNPRAIIFPVYLAIVSTLCGGCKKKGTEEVLVHEFSEAPIPETIVPPVSAREVDTAKKEIPPPDAFVIKRSEYEKILTHRNKGLRYATSYDEFAPDGQPGYPPNAAVDETLLNNEFAGGGVWGLRYRTTDNLFLNLPDKSRAYGIWEIGVGVDAITLIRDRIKKYQEWCEVATKENLPHAVEKLIGKVGAQGMDPDFHRPYDYELRFIFVTPDKMRIEIESLMLDVDGVVLDPSGVKRLEQAVTYDLLPIRDHALKRIKAAEIRIAAEDMRRALLESKAKAKQDAVDAALK